MKEQNIIPTSQYILDSSREYSVYVCENRAIPRITDGLKDAQRKALWLIRNKAEKIKVISLAGELISSNLYVHSDQSAAGAISLLAAPFCNNVPLLEGIGSFGTRVSPVDGIGASRYIYVKRNAAVENIMFKDIDIVPLKENYDGSALEPVTFLPLIPSVLLNGISGIAVGWSTDIFPRKIEDLIDATIAAVEGKKIKKLQPYYSYLTCDIKHIENNSWEFTGKCKILNSSTVQVTELPPNLTLEKFVSRLNKMEEDEKIRGYVDRSTKTIDIQIKFKLGTIGNWTEEKVIDYLGLKSKKNERFVVVDFGGSAIKQYDNAEDMVYKFVEWRLGYFFKRYEKRIADDSYELLYWKAVKKCFDKKLPAKIIGAADKSAIEKIVVETVKGIEVDDKQIDKIVSLPTYRWAVDYYNTVVAKIEELEKNIATNSEILKDPVKIKSIYKEELVALKKMKF